MFDYPLPRVGHTIYAEMGIGPEATAEEVRSAKQRLTSTLTARKRNLDKQIKAILNDVKARGPETAADDEASGIEALHSQAASRHPEFRSLFEQSEQLDEQIRELNSLLIEDPKWRAVYDADHPPCALLKLEDGSTSIFDDRQAYLQLVRRSIFAFLKEKGLECYHPSDLTREDFSYDFVYNPLLDNE